jgi:hypothetical protein
MSRGPFGWRRSPRPADAAKIRRGAASADRFAWKPGEVALGSPRRRGAAKDRVVPQNMRPAHGD